MINVGFDNLELKNDDGTYELIKNTFSHPKFKIITSEWDKEKQAQVSFSLERANIALEQCRGKYCLYIQGDEVLHEQDYGSLHDAILELENKPQVEAPVFKYWHFYGNVDVIRYTRSIYRREVRLIRNHLGIQSWLDAQGFRHLDERKLNCQLVDATVFHYGWAREEKTMRQKVKVMDKFYHGKDFEAGDFEYKKVWGLKKFTDSHPSLMDNWIEKNRNSLDPLSYPTQFEWKNIGLAITDSLEALTGYRLGEYKNYRII